MTAQSAWTVGMLRAAITDIPDDTLLAITAEDFTDPNLAVEQVVISAGFRTVDWGDGYGPEQSKVFGLNCEVPEGPIELRPGRPARALTVHVADRSSPSRAPSPRPDRELEAEP